MKNVEFSWELLTPEAPHFPFETQQYMFYTGSTWRKQAMTLPPRLMIGHKTDQGCSVSLSSAGN